MTKQLRACKTVERETLFDANKFQSWKIMLLISLMGESFLIGLGSRFPMLP